MEELARQYAGPVALALIIGYLSRYVEPRSRVVHWFPAAFRFDVPVNIPNQPQQRITFWTHALTIQNLGWRAAPKVEVIHKSAPQHFQIQPGVKYSVSTNIPTGEHVVEIDSLGRRELITMQIIGVGIQPPPLVGVKSGDGAARPVRTRQNLVISRPRQWFFLILIIIGFVTAFVWAARMLARVLNMLNQLS